MNASRLLIVVIVLQALVLLGQWTGSGPLATAQAQVPDAGAQRIQIIDELKTLNTKMDKLIEVMESGKVKVAEDKK